MTALSPAQISELAGQFLSGYDATAKDAIWRQQSDAFRQFWQSRILSEDTDPLSNEESDAMIRILDRNAKGNTRTSEAVAGGFMITQGAWRRMFNELRANKRIATLMRRIFEAEDEQQRITLVDELYDANQGQINRLTVKSGITINLFLAAYDPFNNLSIVSLNDRRRLMEFLALSIPFNWEKASAGRRIVETNTILRSGLETAGISGSARTLSCFCYSEPFRSRWKAEHTVKRPERSVSVSVPAISEEETSEKMKATEMRESLQIQAALAEIGARMGLSIWLPKADRARILNVWRPAADVLLEELPLNYENTTLRTVEQIDVLWLKKRSIVRAFEVEHTTSIYSGLLRMADLVALQPNLNINLHIVAPAAKRERVFQEIRRPVFSLLEPRPLADICTYLSYESIRDLVGAKHLDRLSDAVIEDYEERAE